MERKAADDNNYREVTRAAAAKAIQGAKRTFESLLPLQDKRVVGGGGGVWQAYYNNNM